MNGLVAHSRPLSIAFLGVLCLLATPASAFEWSGKLKEATTDLDNPDANRRAKAIKGLVYFGWDQVRPMLVEALDDPNSIVQVEAMNAMVEMGAFEEAHRFHRYLSNPDPTLRIGAIEALGEIGGPADVDAMTRTLGDGDAKVRSATIRSLGRLGLTEVRAPIATMLNDKDREVVVRAIEALASIGDRTAVFPLLEKVKDPSLSIQLAAIQALGRLGDTRAVLPLVGLLYSHHPDVQLTVVDALGRLGDPRASGPLTKLMWAHHQQPLGSRVLYALGDIGDPTSAEALLQVMRYSSTARAAADALKRVGAGAIPTVLGALRQSRDTSFQGLCLSVLQHMLAREETPREMRLKVTEALLPALGNTRYPEDELLGALLLSRQPEALGPLIWHLEHLLNSTALEESAPLREKLLAGLADFEDARVVGPLLRVFDKLPEEEQTLAMTIFGAARDPQALDVLGTALEKGSWSTQIAAVRALGRIDHPRSGRLLLEHLRTDRSHLLGELGIGLGANSSPEVGEALLRIARKSSGEVRFTALQALSDHQRRDATSKASEVLLKMSTDSPDERIAVRALDALGPTPVSDGIDELSDRYESAGLTLRTKIVQVLGDWRSPEALDLLLGAVDERNPVLRGEVAWAMGQIGDKRATQALIGMLDDARWPVAVNASAALVRLADPAAKDAFNAQLASPSSAVRTNALLGLSAIDAAPDRGRLLSLAHREADPKLVEVVARILASRGEEADMQAIKNLQSRTSDPAANTLMARLTGVEETPKDGQGWIRYVFSDAGRRMVGQRVIVIMPDGVLVGKASDSAGEVRVEHLGKDRCRVVFLDDVFTAD